MFWLMFALMIVVALVILTLPLWKRTAVAAVGARAKEEEPDTAAHQLLLSPRGIAAVVIMALPALAATLYYSLGNPQLVNINPAVKSAPAPASKMQTAQVADIQTLFERLKQRLEANPDDGQGWKMMGLTYMHYEQFDQAIEAYQKAVALLPDDEDARTALDRAISAQAGTNEPQSAPVAVEKRMMGPDGKVVDVGMMVNRLRDRLEANPDNLDGWMMLGRSYMNLKLYDQAVYAYKHALELSPADSNIEQLLVAARNAVDSAEP